MAKIKAKDFQDTLRKEVSEHRHAVSLIRALELNKFPELERVVHIPNGGHRNIGVARKLKSEGVRRGVPDYLYFKRVGEYTGLAVELKKLRGRATKEQKEWLRHLSQEGWSTHIALGWEEAFEIFWKYIRGEL